MLGPSLRWNVPSADRTIPPAKRATAATSAPSGPPFFPEAIEVVTVENDPYMLGPDRRRVSAQPSHRLSETRARKSNENQEHLDHDGVSDLGPGLLRSKHFLTPGKLGFAYPGLGV